MTTFAKLRSIVLFVLISIPALSDEYAKTKIFDETSEQVYAAALKAARQQGEILESDEQNRRIRFRWAANRVALPGGRMSEGMASFYATVALRPDTKAGRTQVRMTVGQVNIQSPVNPSPLPPGFKPIHTQEARFAKDFFRNLQHTLNP